MKKLITAIFFLPFFTQAQTSYDRKQDTRITTLEKTVKNEQIKTVALQNDVNALKIKTVQQDKDIAQLKNDVVKLTARLDAIKVLVIAFEKSQFNVSAPIKDTVKIQLK